MSGDGRVEEKGVQELLGPLEEGAPWAQCGLHLKKRFSTSKAILGRPWLRVQRDEGRGHSQVFASCFAHRGRNFQ